MDTWFHEKAREWFLPSLPSRHTLLPSSSSNSNSNEASSSQKRRHHSLSSTPRRVRRRHNHPFHYSFQTIMPSSKPTEHANVVEELNFVLDRLQANIQQAREYQQRTAARRSRSPIKSPIKSNNNNTDNNASSSSPPRSRLGSLLSSFGRSPEARQQQSDESPPKAVIVNPPCWNVNHLIEDLRRAAELVVVGENAVTAMEKKQQRKVDRSKQEWKGHRDNVLEMSFDDPSQKEHNLESEYELATTLQYQAQLFDLFMERQGLQLMVDLVLGKALQAQDSADDPTLRLPPLTVATQAIQSISILIQNVSKVTSLYVLLSNNLINRLIGMPLDDYTSAERQRQISSRRNKNSNLTQTFTSPLVTELTTHFVTLLKSLAMRVTTETLQFFLQYPGGGVGAVAAATSSSDTDQRPKIQFPLYERALEFCGAHQDSFVRTTAMNICLNILRLTTMGDDDKEIDTNQYSKGDPPDTVNMPSGVLHGAQALPFPDRLAIAQYACVPARVEKLIAPIFTKLAERWNGLEEQMREIDSIVADSTENSRQSVRNSKAAQAKEKVRRDRVLRSFRDKADNLQDELLFLDDVFRVSLTVLNEQMIEMMLATFVYPLLLQPLLLYLKRLETGLQSFHHSAGGSAHPFGGYQGDPERLNESLRPVSGPAKTALLTLGACFQLLSNKPLLRLLYTALFHPLSPDSTSVPTVRSQLEVSTLRRGRPVMRLDDSNSAKDSRETYAFGTSKSNRRQSHAAPQQTDVACIFVLAPALAEVLEFRGHDLGLLARTKANPYRQAWLGCLNIPDEFADVRQLAVCVFDSAVQAFDGSFASQIVLGTDLKHFADDMPADERNMQSRMAYDEDDRGLGRSRMYDSRISLGKSQSVGADHVADLVSSLTACIVYAHTPQPQEWEAGFDPVASHALLYTIRHSPRALQLASKAVDKLWRQAASLVTARASSVLSPLSTVTIRIRGAPPLNDPRYDEKLLNALLDILLYGSPEYPRLAPAVTDLLLHKEESSSSPDTEKGESGNTRPMRLRLDTCSTDVAHECNFQDVTKVLSHRLADPSSEDSTEVFSLLMRRKEGFDCLFRLNALTGLLRDLAATSGRALHKKDFKSLVARPGGIYENVEHYKMDMTRRMYAILSSNARDTLFSTAAMDALPTPGSILDLHGSPAVPCVCEAPPVLPPALEGIVAEGVSWLSLYLVVKEDSLVFCQPHENNETRVICASPLERLWLEQDRDPSIDNASPARRLLLQYTWLDDRPPPLFLFDGKIPTESPCGGAFVRLEWHTSALDIWFENQQIADNAFAILSRDIFHAKSRRGQRLQEFLAYVQ